MLSQQQSLETTLYDLQELQKSQENLFLLKSTKVEKDKYWNQEVQYPIYGCRDLYARDVIHFSYEGVGVISQVLDMKLYRVDSLLLQGNY